MLIRPALTAAVSEAFASASDTGAATTPELENAGPTVTAPVEELTEMVSKPFCDRTGPEKVVFAMIPHMRARGAVCMSSGRDQSAPRITPE
jgi:hypothetical protein